MDVSVNVCLAGLSTTALGLRLYLKPSQSQPSSTCSSSSSPTSSLTWIYLPAHLLALFSDWLQGPYVFQLYRHHGHSDGSIALLFLAGYVSSCFLGSLSGPLADKYGRRKMGQVFCVICAVNCFLKVTQISFLLKQIFPTFFPDHFQILFRSFPSSLQIFPIFFSDL